MHAADDPLSSPWRVGDVAVTIETYIDESGDFEWARSGISLFAAVNIADRSLAAISEAFENWRTSDPGGKWQISTGAGLDPRW